MTTLRTIVLLSIIGIFSISAISYQSNKIDWNGSEQLTWNDFRGQAPGLSSHVKVAATNYEIGYEYTMIDNDFHFDVTCQFVPALSWVRESGKTDYILKHEQKHFDLAEVYARKLRKELGEANITLRNHQSKINEIYDEVWMECQKAQQEYDHATDHSINEEAQKKWDKKIQQKLEDLEKYAL